MSGSKIMIIHTPVASFRAIRDIVARLHHDGSDSISVVSLADKGKLEKHGVTCKTVSDYVTPQEQEQILQDSIAFVYQLGRKSITGNTNLIEILEYQGTSLWWFMEHEFYHYHIREIIYYLAIFKLVLEKENPQKIVVVNDGYLARLVSIIADRMGTPVQFIPPPWLQMIKATARRVQAALTFRSLRLGKDLFRFLIMNWNRVLPTPPARKTIYRRKILLSPSGVEQVISDPATGKRRKEDLVLGPIASQLAGEESTQLVCLSAFINAIKSTLSGVRRQSIPFRFLAFYLTPKVCQSVLAQKRILKEKWEHLQKDNDSRQAFTYQGVNFWDIFKEKIEALFCYQAPRIIEAIELSKRLLEVEKPDAVVMAAETSNPNRALTAACHQRGIPVIALQHGVVVADEARFSKYRYTADDRDGRPSKLTITPDRFCVSGESIRKVLLQLGFPDDHIAIIGQPRYDKLSRAGEIYDRNRFCARWGIDPAKRIVLIGSQPYFARGIPFRDRELKCIHLALKNEPHIQIVVKPHNYEKEQRHQELAREAEVNAAILPPNADTNEALYACDVLVTFFSTIALEAMILGKPVVTVNLLGYPDPVPYAQNGFALGVYRAEDMGATIKQALDDQETRQRLATNSQRYLEEQFYRLDGRATERLTKVVYNMIDMKAGARPEPALKV